jgi:hypothetical protein
MSKPPRRAVFAVLAVTAAVAAGCGGPPSTKDFAKQAVSFIEGDMARNSQLNGLTLTAATCDEPESTKAGTEYACTAMGSDGQQRALTVKIVDRNTLQVTDLQPPAPANDGGTASTTTAAGPATTAPAPPTTVAPTPGG